MTGLRPEGRLELTWTNKHRRLLAHDDSSYEWVDPSDYRVAEVRLLHDVATVGEETHSSKDRAKDNLVIRGDALSALTSLIELPEFGREYAGKVRLVYIDPPFNTGQTFKDYDDGLEHSVWLTMLRDRLEQIKTLLAPNGSVWLHLNEDEIHRARCVMDEVFGLGHFVATVIWQKVYTVKNSAKHFSKDHDYVVVYSRSEKDAWTRNLLPRTEEMDGRYSNPDNDPRGPWKAKPLHATKPYKAGVYPITTPSGRVIDGPPPGAYWRTSKERLTELATDNRLWFGADGSGEPSIKGFQSEAKDGKVPQTWWPHDEVGSSATAKAEVKALAPNVPPFSTPKPEALMKRILEIGTDPGDLVLDCFLGSGTTAAVAHKLGRRWVGIEWSPTTISNYTLPRLRSVVDGQDDGGVSVVETPSGEASPPMVKPGDSKAAALVVERCEELLVGDLNLIDQETLRSVTAALRELEVTEKVTLWSGGGGFRVLDVAPSMFEADEGRVYLAEWAVNGALGEATAAQLGYAHKIRPPFCGVKGRTRLAVVDGLVNADVAQVLAGALDEDERMVVCGTSLDPAARSVLRQLRPGSTLRKIPSSILDEYRLRRRSKLRDLLTWDEAVDAMDTPESEEASS